MAANADRAGACLAEAATTRTAQLQSSGMTVSASPGTQPSAMGEPPRRTTTWRVLWQNSSRVAPGTWACMKPSMDAGMLTR